MKTDKDKIIFTSIDSADSNNKNTPSTYFGSTGMSSFNTNNLAVDIKNPENTIRIPINDDPYDNNLFLQLLYDTNILQKIHTSINNKEPVLVHCFAGQQRSCALVACYLLKYNNMNPYQAINYIKEKRRIAFFGNINFISAIVNFFYKL